MKINFTPAMVAEITRLLEAGAKHVDTSRNLRVFGSLSGNFSHLVLIVPDDGAKLDDLGMIVPIPESLGRGYLAAKRDFPNHE